MGKGMRIFPVNTIIINSQQQNQKRQPLISNFKKEISCGKVSFKAGKINFDKFVTAMYEMIGNSSKKTAGTYVLAHPEEFFLALCQIIKEMTERQNIYSGRKHVDLRSLKAISNNSKIALSESKLDAHLQFALGCLYLVPEHVIAKHPEALKSLPPDMARSFRQGIKYREVLHTKKASADSVLIFLKKQNLKPNELENYRRELIENNSYEPLITILSDPKIKDARINNFCRDVILEIMDNANNNMEMLRKINSDLEASQGNLQDIILGTLSYDKANNQLIVDKLGIITNLYRYLDLKIETLAQQTGAVKI